MFFGARSLTMASKPFQKTSLATPLAGRTLSSMKRWSSVATWSPWAVVRAVMGVLLEKDAILG